MIDALTAPAINQLRFEVGLQPVKRILDRWWASPDLTLGLFPEWFSVPHRDLPPGMRCVGFPLADSGDLLHADAQTLVHQALAPLGGNRPVVFAPGSAHAHAKPFLTAAAEACSRLNVPGVLLSSAQDQFPGGLPTNIVTANYLPFRELLRGARAIVHHGGIGTTSQAFAAGLPQLVTPMAFDQFDNAARVERLGCGSWLAMTRVSAERLSHLLNKLLASRQVQLAAGKIADQIAHSAATPTDLADVILNHFQLPPVR